MMSCSSAAVGGFAAFISLSLVPAGCDGYYSELVGYGAGRKTSSGARNGNVSVTVHLEDETVRQNQQ